MSLHPLGTTKRSASILSLLILLIGLSPALSATILTEQVQPPSALQLAQAQDSRKVEADQLLDQGIEQYNTSQFEAAMQSWQQALNLYQELKDRLGEGNALGNLGVAYFSLGNYPKAIEVQEQSLAIARELKDRLGEGQSLGNLGNAYDALGNYPKAIEVQDQRLAIARELKDRLGEGKALGNLGNAYKALGNYPKAIELQEQSLAIAREIKDRLWEGQSLGNLGNAYYALGNYPRAIEVQEQSLAIARELKDRRGEGNALGNLGNAYYSLGNYPKAIELQEQSLAIAREIKDRQGEGNALGNLGLARFNAGQLPQAEQDLLAAIAVFESLRDRLTDSQKVSIADTQFQAYNNLQRVLIAQNKVGPALEIAERGRARAFAELLAKRTQGQETLTIQPIQMAAIQQVAREQKATLVEYANIYDEQLFIWVVKPTGEVVFRQVDFKPLQQQKTSLGNLVAAARCLGAVGCEEAMASRGSQPVAFNVAQGDRQFGKAPVTTIKNEYLQQLHKLLIAPIADLLPKDPNERVIFVPQGRMFLLPFAALQDEQGKYLIEKHTIAVSPSIQVLQLTHKQRQFSTKTGNVLLVGNPKMPSVIYKPGDPPGDLLPLPGAEQEAKAIAKLLNVPALIGAQATKVAVLKQMPQARIIHLATHGLLDDLGGVGVPGAIALAPSSSAPNDGLLTANELLDLKLKAELVVLSACDTGKGKITGDGVIGLSRSLITAGVPSVIVSLWKVPDAPTAELMTDFYRYLNQGRDKATALRQAMLDTKQKYPDPIAWAPFELIGEAE
ncbi:hypothetical protein BST81_09185 [Leptolyngbya sp. 'hensonii']|uniref:CHAT domain-containing protein n=1 Tax=Leptolyngbya sp. 'hensonii' TaxID=1922337 RepID=UPI00094FB71D|nr:CHAT domain-containing tetratricopeptide repeat protein [Leptolyngbya sp. 'hensonii']OLP18686.1 hypothetical protein BST81_09185 [Leptolyngbya sp. 'hensonii']